MHNRIVYNVVHGNDEWRVVKTPEKVVEGRFKNKTDAIELGRFLAMREEVGELHVRQVDGSIQCQFTFGKDPHKVEG